MTNPKFGKIVSIVCAIFIVLCGIAFVISAAHLFFTGGDNPYSRESVGEYLSYLAIPSVLTIILVIAGLIYDLVTKEKMSDGFKRSESEMLEGYAKRFEIEKLDNQTQESVIRERNTRLGVKIFFYPISALFLLFAFIYLVFIAEFTVESLSDDVILALLVTLPLVAASIAIMAICAFLFEKSARAERSVLLEAAKSGYKCAPPVIEKTTDKEKKMNLIFKYVTLGIAILFIVVGIFNGGMTDVLDKAVKICTECIGLG